MKNSLIFPLKEKKDSAPIWLMRQAGRYLPEYREIRATFPNFLDFCYSPKHAAEVTLQPIRRFSFDYAIIFSDILVLPHALNWPVTFEKGEGPLLKQFKEESDLTFLKQQKLQNLEKVYQAIDIVKSNLPNNVGLIGFAGSPWTVMTYMLEGKGKQDFSVSRNFVYQQKNLALRLVELIAEKTIEHLINQVKAGADTLQLFDSWAGVLSAEEYEEFVILPTKKIVQQVKKSCPKVKIIGFPRGSGFLYEDYILKTGIDAVGVDQFVPLDKIRKWQENIVVQGNLDPVTLLANKEIIAAKCRDILNVLGDKNFIFNLGHGILPTTPVENVEFLVDYVRDFYR